jgi:hypothetical protein
MKLVEETLQFEREAHVRKVNRQHPSRLIRVGQNVLQQPLVDEHPRQNHVMAIASDVEMVVEALGKVYNVGTELTDRRLQFGLWATTACSPFASNSTSFLKVLKLAKVLRKYDGAYAVVGEDALHFGPGCDWALSLHEVCALWRSC